MWTGAAFFLFDTTLEANFTLIEILLPLCGWVEARRCMDEMGPHIGTPTQKILEKIRLRLPRVAGELCHIFFQQDWVIRNMFINMVLILMIMHLAWKVVGENWG